MAGNYERKDHLYNKAKSDGYRSRAAYKLIELDQKYGLLKPGLKILDLGAWPGGWLQVSSARVGQAGQVVGVDLIEIDRLPQPNVKLLTGDLREEETLKKASALCGSRFDMLLSDMAPNLCGIPEVDRVASAGCAELALWCAGQALRMGGTLVIKVFKSNETDLFLKSMRPSFNKTVRAELESTRKTSSEYYILGFGFKAPAQPMADA